MPIAVKSLRCAWRSTISAENARNAKGRAYESQTRVDKSDGRETVNLLVHSDCNHHE